MIIYPMNLKELYLYHTFGSNTCPICNQFVKSIGTPPNNRIPCACGFIKFNTGFNIETKSNVYIFNIKFDHLAFPIDSFTSYTQLLNYINKLEVFQ